MKLRLLLTYALVSLVPSLLLAEERDSVSMDIDLIAWGDSIEGLSFRSGEKQKKITAKPFIYSESVRYNGPQLLEIHQAKSAKAPQQITEEQAHQEAAADAPVLLPPYTNKEEIERQTWMDNALEKRREQDPSIVALVRLPLDAKQVTILLSPREKGTYQGHVMIDDSTKLPLGKLKIHNLSPYPIAIQLMNEEKKELQTRETMLVEAERGRVVYALSYQLDGKWKVQEQNITRVLKDEQTHFIALSNKGQHFISGDGSSGGFLQKVILRRKE